MATFASDYVNPTVSKIRGGGGVVGALPPAPTVTTPSVPSAAGTSNKSYLASAIKQKAPAPVQQPTAPAAPAAPQYDFSQDAQLGTDAMNLARQVAAMSKQAETNAGYTTSPAGVNYSPTADIGNKESRPMTNEERLANYKPEVVQGMYGGNEYATTSAGLKAPERSNYDSHEEYLKAVDTYGRLALMEQDTEANSIARQFTDARNAEQEAVTEMRRRVAAADAAQKDVARKNANERQILANQLASRGLDPNTDTWAMNKVAEAERLDREEQSAAANIASLDAAALQTQATASARKALVERIASINAAKAALVTSDAKASKVESDLLLAQAKEENYQSQVDYRTAEAERKAAETDLKADRNPGLIALDEARANKLISDKEYLEGVKTLQTEAQTEKTKAETNRINTLLPAELAKMQATVAKLKSSGTGGKGGGTATATPDELAAVYRLNGGKAPISDKSMAQLLNQVRTVQGNIDQLVQTQDTRMTETVAAKNAGKPNSTAEDFAKVFLGS